MLTIEADIYEYVRMSYVDKNILGPLVHMVSQQDVHTHSSLTPPTPTLTTKSFLPNSGKLCLWTVLGK